GYTAPVVVNIFGDDLDVLDHKARELAKVVGAVAGATDVTLPSPPGLPQLTVRLRKADLQRWALDPVEALEGIRTAYEGDTVAQTYEGNHVFPVIAILDPANRARVDEVANLRLATPSGGDVRLQQARHIYECRE